MNGASGSVARNANNWLGVPFPEALADGTDIGLGGRRNFAVRLEGDYVGIHSSSPTTSSARLSAGIVYRIGDK
jgi:hypothetical protein